MLCCVASLVACFFFFNDTATTDIYTLSLHDALPIFTLPVLRRFVDAIGHGDERGAKALLPAVQRSLDRRSEEHTSELQSRQYLVCRLLLEKKKIILW